MLSKVNHALRAWLWPERCRFCRLPPGPVCGDCCTALPWVAHACPRCARVGACASLCAGCTRQPPPQQHTWAPLRYEAPIAPRIVAFKFDAELGAAGWLAGLMVQRLSVRPQPLPELLIPVPLHAARLRARGYNQALELGRPLARRLGLELAPALARRVRATREQTVLDAGARRRNLQGAFAVHGVAGRHVALLDDVITTGATLSELARAARAAGAARIECWALARA